jgi:hypothetical protein
LEGIGLISKYKKNKIRWAGDDKQKRSSQIMFSTKRLKKVEEDNDLALET